MNVYDFDKTIYPGDSSVEFYCFALQKHPLLLRYAFVQLAGFILFYLRLIDKTRLKEYFFSFLGGVDANLMAKEFWVTRKHKVCSWYIKQKMGSDVVISASPEFLLRPVLTEMGISNLIASRVDPMTGKFHGKNCHGEEKVHRFIAEYGHAPVERFYSDSYSDEPLAKYAEQAYLVKGSNPYPWDFSSGR